jgi:hypothetical protein
VEGQAVGTARAAARWNRGTDPTRRPSTNNLRKGDGGDVDATSEFATVVRYKLGRHRVVMAAEIDAQAPPEAQEKGEQQQAQQGGQRQGGQRQYMELKSYKIPGHPRAEANMYSQKHPRW